MSPIDRPGLLASISEVLRRASVPVPTWHLAPRSRWVMLRDTLLGHAPIRGGLRPRDLPFDPDAREAISMAADVHGLEPYEVRAAIPAEVGSSPLQPEGKPGTIAFRDWIVCYSALVEYRLGHAPDSHDQVCRQAVYDCIRELRRAMGLNERGAAEPRHCPFVHRMLGLLGLSQQEWLRLSIDSNDRNLARVGALLRRYDPAAVSQGRLDASDQAMLSELKAMRFRLFTLKTSKVQDYLARGKYHWLMRGGSTWCAQALALSRDLVLSDEEHAQGLFLLSDSDAIVSFLGPETASLDEMVSALEGNVRTFWGDDSEGFSESDTRFPRLAAWRNQARRAGVRPSSVMPDLVVACSEPRSLADLCGPSAAGEGPEPQRRTLRWNIGCADAPPCAYVEKDRGLCLVTPEWLQPEDPRKPRAMGWTSLVWSLCGATFRTHAHEGLASELVLPDLVLAPVDLGKSLERWGRQNESVAYVKIDGDSVGDRFRNRRVPELPGLGLALVQSVFRRVTNAAKKILAASGNSPATGLPLDLVYLGGDDLLCRVPDGLLPALLDAFGEELVSGDPWSDVTFTFAAIELPPKSEIVVGEGQGFLEQLTVGASRAIGPALEYAKVLTKGETEQAAEKAAALRDTLHKAGANLTCVGHLERFGCVRGVRMRIAAMPEQIG